MNATVQPERAEYVWPVRVYWEDTDAGGIVFYANYLKFFERARTEWLRSLGINQQALRLETGGMFVVADTHVRYLHPARLDDELIVTARLQEIGKASMTIQQEARLKNSGVVPPPSSVLCSGTIRIGWVHSEKLSPARIPPAILKLLT